MSKYIPKTIDIYLVIVLFLIFHIYIPDKHVKQTSISYIYVIWEVISYLKLIFYRFNLVTLKLSKHQSLNF